ncbi:hypothetical protein N7G274_001545 [Stereocaulon virgatum]|uniref:Uncharacterized protein n=1 Tax=Stereocaulon virgatum TaxID=373712 RepID=A0ABR4ALV0_9LECA
MSLPAESDESAVAALRTHYAPSFHTPLTTAHFCLPMAQVLLLLELFHAILVAVSGCHLDIAKSRRRIPAKWRGFYRRRQATQSMDLNIRPFTYWVFIVRMRQETNR